MDVDLGNRGSHCSTQSTPFLPRSSLTGARKALNWGLGDLGSSLLHQQAGQGGLRTISPPREPPCPFSWAGWLHSRRVKWTSSPDGLMDWPHRRLCFRIEECVIDTRVCCHTGRGWGLVHKQGCSPGGWRLKAVHQAGGPSNPCNSKQSLIHKPPRSSIPKTVPAATCRAPVQHHLSLS